MIVFRQKNIMIIFSNFEVQNIKMPIDSHANVHWFRKKKYIFFMCLMKWQVVLSMHNVRHSIFLFRFFFTLVEKRPLSQAKNVIGDSSGFEFIEWNTKKRRRGERRRKGSIRFLFIRIFIIHEDGFAVHRFIFGLDDIIHNMETRHKAHAKNVSDEKYFQKFSC